MTVSMPHPGEIYHPETAYWMALLSHWAYRDEEETEEEWSHRTRRKLLKIGFEDVCFLGQSFIAVHPEYRVLVIRGTDEKEDWKTNLDAGKVPWFRGEVHSGFRAMMSALSVVAWSTENSRQPLYIAAHSLGGAVGMMYAASLQRDGLGPCVRGVYTFGQPRVGDPAFARWYGDTLGERTYRHVNCADAVPHLPGFMPGWFKTVVLGVSALAPWLLLVWLALVTLWPSGYRHTGQMIYSDRRGKLHRNSSRLFRCWDRVLAILFNLGRYPVSLKHHSQGDSYVTALESHIPKDRRCAV